MQEKTGKMTGRIVRSLSGFYDVWTPAGVITCRARGILRKEGNSPLINQYEERRKGASDTESR